MTIEEARRRIIVALDVSDVETARSYAQELAPYVGLFKVGKESFVRYGTEATATLVDDIKDLGFKHSTLSGLSVGLDDYIAHLRSRGPAWKAVAMARRAFRRRVRPLREWLPMSYDSCRRPTPVKERER